MVYKYFHTSSRLPFHFDDDFFCCADFQFHKALLVYFCFCCYCFSCQIQKKKKAMPSQMLRILPLVFSSRGFMTSGLMFNYLIHFEFCFVLFLWLVFHSLHVTIQFSNTVYWHEYPFSIIFSLSVHGNWHIHIGIFLCCLFCSFDLYACFYANIILFW